MEVSPDTIVYWKWGVFELSATLVYTWVVMGLLLVISWLATRKITSGPDISAWQNLLESVVDYMRDQIREVMQDNPDRYLPFIGTLFLFIVIANILDIVPGYHPPTGSMLTTGALAISVFFAVPVFGIERNGFKGFLKHYIQPSVFMLPFNVIGELSRTLALAVRLFGNIMSGTMIVGILISITPFFIPVVMELFGLLIGVIQAYIFAILATVYIGSGMRVQKNKEDKQDE